MDYNLLKKRKKELGLSYDDLAAMSGIPKTTITNIFTGRTDNPRVDTMQAIENALGLNHPTEEKAAALTDKEQRLLAGFNKLIPPMQDYVIEMVESLTNKEIAANNKRA